MQSLGILHDKFNDGTVFEINYIFISGSKFNTWLKKPKEYFEWLEYNPDFIVISLGGNSIVDYISDKTIKDNWFEWNNLNGKE